MHNKALLIITSCFMFSLVIFLVIEKPNSPREVSFAPLFQILGKFVQTADATFSRILAAGEWDEAEFGDELKKRFDKQYEVTLESIYLNDLVSELSQNSRKDFEYTVYVDYYMAPNAYAMAGGVIVVADELLDLLENEAQIASILAHEIAHIELDHCLNAVKFELAEREYNLDTPGFFSGLYDLLIGISFSKTQEDESDAFAYSLITTRTDYWPEALSDGFQLFIEAYGEAGDRLVLEEFFQSHPDMEYRRDKYLAKAEFLKGTGEKYIGASNLNERIPMTDQAFDDEWEVY